MSPRRMLRQHKPVGLQLAVRRRASAVRGPAAQVAPAVLLEVQDLPALLVVKAVRAGLHQAVLRRNAC